MLLQSLLLFVVSIVSVQSDLRLTRRILPVSADSFRSDSDECLDNFQISTNTIIRTQDSRNLGAKFLNETELPSKEQCMQWCCETSSCNVAVYEEKNKGSCYVFDCGPMSDFKCQFTSHNHYSSAILRVNPHSYDLGKWGAETRHEQELNQLRDTTTIRQEVTTTPTTTTTEKTTTTSTTPSTTPIPTTTTAPPIPSTKAPAAINGRRCSRFQFECHNTSECIAIYNACDGIPQCSDGSDESAELGCPAAGNSRNSNAHADQVNVPNEKPADLERGNGGHNAAIPPVGNRHSAVEIDRQQPHQWSGYPHEQEYIPPRQQSAGFNNQKLSRPESHQSSSIFTHKDSGLHPNNYPEEEHPIAHDGYLNNFEGNQQDEYGETMKYNNRIRKPPPPNYLSQDYDSNDYWQRENDQHLNSYKNYNRPRPQAKHESAHEGNMVQSYSHGHKQNHLKPPINTEGGRKVPDYYEDRNNYPSNSDNQNSDYSNPKLTNSFEPHRSAYQETHPPNEFHQSQELTNEMNQAEANLKKMHLDLNDHNPYQEDNLGPENSQEMNGPNGLDENINAFNTNIPKLNPTKISVPEDQPNSKEDTEKIISTTATEHSPMIKNLGSSVHAHSQLNKVEVNVAEVEVQRVDHTSESSGAVLALALGLSITALLLVLVGCRLRMVRRHLRRGRSSYTHDADYLVNGMYL